MPYLNRRRRGTQKGRVGKRAVSGDGRESYREFSTTRKMQIACSQLRELVHRVHTVYSLKKWQTAGIPYVIRRWGCGNLWCSSWHSHWQSWHFSLHQTCFSRCTQPSHQNTVMDDLQVCMVLRKQFIWCTLCLMSTPTDSSTHHCSERQTCINLNVSDLNAVLHENYTVFSGWVAQFTNTTNSCDYS